MLEVGAGKVLGLGQGQRLADKGFGLIRYISEKNSGSKEEVGDDKELAGDAGEPETGQETALRILKMKAANTERLKA